MEYYSQIIEDEVIPLIDLNDNNHNKKDALPLRFGNEIVNKGHQDQLRLSNNVKGDQISMVCKPCLKKITIDAFPCLARALNFENVCLECLKKICLEPMTCINFTSSRFRSNSDFTCLVCKNSFDAIHETSCIDFSYDNSSNHTMNQIICKTESSKEVIEKSCDSSIFSENKNFSDFEYSSDSADSNLTIYSSSENFSINGTLKDVWPSSVILRDNTKDNLGEINNSDYLDRLITMPSNEFTNKNNNTEGTSLKLITVKRGYVSETETDSDDSELMPYTFSFSPKLNSLTMNVKVSTMTNDKNKIPPAYRASNSFSKLKNNKSELKGEIKEIDKIMIGKVDKHKVIEQWVGIKKIKNCDRIIKINNKPLRNQSLCHLPLTEDKNKVPAPQKGQYPDFKKNDECNSLFCNQNSPIAKHQMILSTASSSAISGNSLKSSPCISPGPLFTSHDVSFSNCSSTVNLSFDDVLSFGSPLQFNKILTFNFSQSFSPDADTTSLNKDNVNCMTKKNFSQRGSETKYKNLPFDKMVHSHSAIVDSSHYSSLENKNKLDNKSMHVNKMKLSKKVNFSKPDYNQTLSSKKKNSVKLQSQVECAKYNEKYLSNSKYRLKPLSVFLYRFDSSWMSLAKLCRQHKIVTHFKKIDKITNYGSCFEGMKFTPKNNIIDVTIRRSERIKMKQK